MLVLEWPFLFYWVRILIQKYVLPRILKTLFNCCCWEFWRHSDCWVFMFLFYVISSSCCLVTLDFSPRVLWEIKSGAGIPAAMGTGLSHRMGWCEKPSGAGEAWWCISWGGFQLQWLSLSLSVSLPLSSFQQKHLALRLSFCNPLTLFPHINCLVAGETSKRRKLEDHEHILYAL